MRLFIIPDQDIKGFTDQRAAPYSTKIHSMTTHAVPSSANSPLRQTVLRSGT